MEQRGVKMIFIEKASSLEIEFEKIDTITEKSIAINGVNLIKNLLQRTREVSK